MRKFVHGWNRQPHDPRDHVHRPPTARQVPWFDVGFSGVPQLNQGNEGSCGPNSAREIITKAQEIQGLPLVGAAELYIYWFTRYLQGTVGEDSGVDNRSMLKAIAGYGFPAAALDPYDDTPASMLREPSPDLVAAAADNRGSVYASVVQSLPQMQGTLVGGRPILFGFEVFPQMLGDEAAETGILQTPTRGLTSVGGHDVSITGFTTVDRPGITVGKRWPAGTFRFRNHWANDGGSYWGDGGYGYIPFGYATSARWAGDNWVIQTIPNTRTRRAA